MVMGIARARSLPQLSHKAVGGGDLASEPGRAWTSPEAQWLGLPTFTTEGLDSILGQVTKIAKASWYGQNTHTHTHTHTHTEN